MLNEPSITPELAEAAYKLAGEMHDGRWEHIAPRDKTPIMTREIIQVLRDRCPGYSVEQYHRALAKSLHASMK
jgi:hypothetical protein